MIANKQKLVVSFPYAILVLIALAMVLTGCELYEPSNVSTNKIRVEEEKISETVAVADLNDAALDRLSNHYRKHGDGPLELTVTYDPKSRNNGAMRANDEVARLSRELRMNGINNVEVGILPVNGAGNDMDVLVAYRSYNALAPEGCDVLLSDDRGFERDAYKDYKLGCTKDTLFARQVARPKDLRGTAPSGDPTSDGRRSSNVIEGYRSGVPNEPLEGQSASGEE